MSGLDNQTANQNDELADIIENKTADETEQSITEDFSGEDTAAISEKTATGTTEDNTTVPTTTEPVRIMPEFTGKYAELDKLIWQYGEGVSVFYKDLTDGEIYFYNPDRRYFIASVIKAPYAAYVYKCIIEQEKDYDPAKKYTYIESDYRDGTGKIKTMEYGTEFTLEELIYYAIRSSDNVAMDKIRKIYPAPGFIKYMTDRGIPHAGDIKSAVNGNICAQCAAVYLEFIYEFIEENNKYSQTLKEHMLNTVNKMIYSCHPFVRKYGWTEDAFHDMGIVYNPEHPYLIAILSNRGGGNFPMFKNISLAIERYHDGKVYEVLIEETTETETTEAVTIPETTELIEPVEIIENPEIPDDIEVITYDMYYSAYKEFMLSYPTVDEENEFPVYGFYLVDMNFDKIPELAVRHHSGGTLGGYFLYYYFDGEEVRPVLDGFGEPARSMDNDWVKMLADFENNKVYILKEMYESGGNDNFAYGYVREIITDENGAVSMMYILETDVEQSRIFADGEWYDISPVDYIEIKLGLIPEDNEFIDLFETELFCLLYEYPMGIGEDEENYRQIAEEEINVLFNAWLESLTPHEDEESEIELR